MAGYSVFRFFRFLRSSCAPITAFIGFSFLLTAIFILYQRSNGPGDVQRLGWQSWESIEVPKSSTVNSGGLMNVTVPEGVEWWDHIASTAQSGEDSMSFPLDVWAPLLPHDTGRASQYMSSYIMSILNLTFSI